MNNLDSEIENVRKKYADMREALIRYNLTKQETNMRLRSMITTAEWPEVRSRMKDWLHITQEMIEREILYTGFDEDCVFGIKYMHKKLPKLRLVKSDEPPRLERLIKEWEFLTHYLLSKGYLDRVPDDPAFELRGYIVGIQELIGILEKDQL